MTEKLPLQPMPKSRCANPSGQFRTLLMLGSHIKAAKEMEWIVASSTGTFDSESRWPKTLALITRRREELQAAIDEYEALVDDDTPVSQQ